MVQPRRKGLVYSGGRFFHCAARNPLIEDAPSQRALILAPAQFSKCRGYQLLPVREFRTRKEVPEI